MTVARLAHRLIGDDYPVYVIAEIGANHNGDLATAIEMVRAAKAAGADAVKFQMRTPEVCIPQEQQHVRKETPWGWLSYLGYRKRLEFSPEQYDEIARECAHLGLDWSASPWDLPSLERLLRFDPPWIKVASPSVTDHDLLRAIAATDKPVLLSTGMSTLDEIKAAVEILWRPDLVILYCKSTYPLPPEDVNLRGMLTLATRWERPVGYSDHTTGIWASFAAAVMGAAVIEKHFTLNRAAFGTDQANSVEPEGLRRIVHYIRRWEQARGDGVLRVLPSEVPIRAKLRRVQGGTN